MKTIIFVRHGKSSWKSPDLKDLERPLKNRGLKEVTLLGKSLQSQQVRPELILCSPALRTVATAYLLAPQLEMQEVTIRFDPELYLISKTNLLHKVRAIEDEYKTVMVIGHNPALTELASHFSEEPVENIPTSGAIGIELECSTWLDAGLVKGKQLFFEYPKKGKKSGKKEKEKETEQVEA